MRRITEKQHTSSVSQIIATVILHKIGKIGKILKIIVAGTITNANSIQTTHFIKTLLIITTMSNAIGQRTFLQPVIQFLKWEPAK